jgi:hypothetical protein
VVSVVCHSFLSITLSCHRNTAKRKTSAKNEFEETVMDSIKRRLIAGVLLLAFGMASLPARAEEMTDDQINTRPTATAMAGDAIFARPALLVLTAVGTGLFVISLPFTVLGGNVKEAAKTMIVGPAKSTFLRCLGCTATQDAWKNRTTVANDAPDTASGDTK